MKCWGRCILQAVGTSRVCWEGLDTAQSLQHRPEGSPPPQTFHYHPQKPQERPLLCRGDGLAAQGPVPASWVRTHIWPSSLPICRVCSVLRSCCGPHVLQGVNTPP